jgi:hypothetical protein
MLNTEKQEYENKNQLSLSHKADKNLKYIASLDQNKLSPSQ